MKIRHEVVPFLVAVLFIGILTALIGAGCGMARSTTVITGIVPVIVLSGYLLFFFRDPERTPPNDPSVIVAGADGIVMRITELREDEFLKIDAIRISIFLSLFDVHVNRAPLSGRATLLGYFPGKHFFTFQEKSSDVNQHNSILIDGEKTRCLINQIVGPVCRRVIYWLDHDRAIDVQIGAKIGMMKFGSRLDMYFPKADVSIAVRQGDRVKAGETVVAKLLNG